MAVGWTACTGIRLPNTVNGPPDTGISPPDTSMRLPNFGIIPVLGSLIPLLGSLISMTGNISSILTNLQALLKNLPKHMIYSFSKVGSAGQANLLSRDIPISRNISISHNISVSHDITQYPLSQSELSFAGNLSLIGWAEILWYGHTACRAVKRLTSSYDPRFYFII